MIHSSTSEPLQWFETEPAVSHIIMIAPVHIPGDLFIVVICTHTTQYDMNITYNLTSATDYCQTNHIVITVLSALFSYDQEVI